MRLGRIVAAMAVLGAAAAAAEPVDTKAARKMLFSPKGTAVQIIEDSGLSDTELSYFRMLAKDPQFDRVARYYGAIAFSPSFIERVAAGQAGPETLALLQFTDSYHTPQAAAAAAMSACEAARARADKPCVLAARIFPKRWKAQPLTMSMAATAAFRQYRRADSPKAFAVSRGGKGFSAISGDDAAATALARCNALEKSPDCEIVVAD